MGKGVGESGEGSGREGGRERERERERGGKWERREGERGGKGGERGHISLARCPSATHCSVMELPPFFRTNLQKKRHDT